MTIEQLRLFLRGGAIHRIRIGGFLDRSGVSVEFHPLYSTVYFDLGSRLLQLETLSTTGRMRIDEVEAIVAPAALEDEEFSVCSIELTLLWETTVPSPILSLSLWDVAEEAGLLSCGAAQFELKIGQNLFVDPFNYFGIRLGDETIRRNWLDKVQEHYPVQLLDQLA